MGPKESALEVFGELSSSEGSLQNYFLSGAQKLDEQITWDDRLKSDRHRREVIMVGIAPDIWRD
jgi:hypothetical protein